MDVLLTKHSNLFTNILLYFENPLPVENQSQLIILSFDEKNICKKLSHMLNIKDIAHIHSLLNILRNERNYTQNKKITNKNSSQSIIHITYNEVKYLYLSSYTNTNTNKQLFDFYFKYRQLLFHCLICMIDITINFNINEISNIQKTSIDIIKKHLQKWKLFPADIQPSSSSNEFVQTLFKSFQLLCDYKSQNMFAISNQSNVNSSVIALYSYVDDNNSIHSPLILKYCEYMMDEQLLIWKILFLIFYDCIIPQFDDILIYLKYVQMSFTSGMNLQTLMMNVNQNGIEDSLLNIKKMEKQMS